MSREHLANYLNDHMAGSIVAMEILDQLEKEAPEWIAHMVELKTDIEADQQELKTLMGRLGITEGRLRKMGSWIAEKLAEFKLNVDDPTDGSLRRFELLEALAIGIDGKRALWVALKAATEISPGLQVLDYLRLIQRAEEQRSRVEAFRLQAARSALGIQT